MPRGSIKIPFLPPIKGFRGDMLPWMQPGDTMVDGTNVVIRDQKLYIRPGLTYVAAFGERIMGGYYYKLTSGVERVIVGGLTKRKTFDGSSFTDITGSDWTGGNTNHARFVEFPYGTAIYAIGVNGKDATIVWDGTASPDSDLGGGAPIAKDITAVASRVIYGNVILGGNSYPSSFMYSAFNDHTSTPAANIISVAESSGHIVAVRNLGMQNFATYTEKAQFVGSLQGGSTPFRVDWRSGQPGPVSAAAVISAGGEVHRYMGKDGNFYKFDGSRCVPFGNAVKTAVQASMNGSYRGYAHGVYDRENRECHWYWVPKGYATVSAGITYNIDLDIWSPIHSFARSITASAEWGEITGLLWTGLTGTWTDLGTLYPTWLSMGGIARQAMLLGGSDGDLYVTPGGSADDGVAIAASWVFPIKAIAGDGKEVYVDAVESYFKELDTTMNYNVYLGHCTAPGKTITYEAAKTFDMASAEVGEAEYLKIDKRYVCLKYEVAETNLGMEYHGGLAYCYPKGVPH